MKTKQELRSAYRQLRKKLNPEQVKEKSIAIRSQFEGWLSEREPLTHFHLFFPIDRFNEVNTFYIMELLEQKDKVIYTSQVSKDSLDMDTLKLPKDAAFFLDEWGIPVPQESIMVSPSKIQVIFVPLLAYDRQGNRVGFGKGYYDHFLAKLGPDVIKIGLSFFEPEEKVNAEAHDVALDFCITPKKVLTF
ncbi:5-formyltetrahydrofolate cyclo-ligase [Algoriphagus sp. AK58]|uniref:5-formyltetrahydrofolate cyclo-ligase n=1 Tax=Algoriphagus sp. AK58 TaxID=1406877 RepID=UPI00164F1AE7|nr:5-formyltetrahydrofolate cyclo-ligase [Algoriphagus sp. AK58]MBC6367156.1 5-formyltetrahydrofolate cyclo-ligase [Algoriphagus sp. AK58]